MPSLEEQIGAIAAAAFADTNAAAMKPPSTPGQSRRRVALAAAVMCLGLAGGLISIARRDAPGPIAPTGTAADSIAPSTTATGPPPSAVEPPITIDTPTSTPLSPPTDPNVEPVSPYNAAFESATGVAVDELDAAIIEAEKRTVTQCVTTRGWVVTPPDLAQVGYRAGLLYDAGTGYASNALVNDQRGQRYRSRR